MIVGKRILRRAVDRNRARRIIREVFRLCQDILAAQDYVVRVTGPLPQDSAELRRDLEAQFLRLSRCGTRYARTINADIDQA